MSGNSRYQNSEAMGTIYRIWNNRNGKSYIGQSYHPGQRIFSHLTGNGSTQIAADLLKYDSSAWQWEILADESDYSTLSLNKLESIFIRQYDSVRTGYNFNEGGGVKPSFRGQWRYWDDEALNRSLKNRGILDAMENYQCLRIHGMTSAQYQRQQEIISQYGSIEAYEQHMERERREQRERERQQAELERQRREEGCTWIVIIIVGVLFIILASQC